MLIGLSNRVAYLELLPHEMEPQLQHLHDARVIDAAHRLSLCIQRLPALPCLLCLLRLLLVLRVCQRLSATQKTHESSANTRLRPQKHSACGCMGCGDASNALTYYGFRANAHGRPRVLAITASSSHRKARQHPGADLKFPVLPLHELYVFKLLQRSPQKLRVHLELLRKFLFLHINAISDILSSANSLLPVWR